MIRSTISAFADASRRRPEWVERDGQRLVTVHGHSFLESLLAGGIILLACVAMLWVMQ